MKQKILILEDDDINQELIQLYLIDDYELNIVSSVNEATDALSKSTYDLIISDLNLGNDNQSDGLSFLKYLRSDNRYKHIPVAAYSGYITPNIPNEYDFDVCISKPITKSEFLKTIADVLNKS